MKYFLFKINYFYIFKGSQKEKEIKGLFFPIFIDGVVIELVMVFVHFVLGKLMQVHYNYQKGGPLFFTLLGFKLRSYYFDNKYGSILLE